jgi:hypothetical protein
MASAIARRGFALGIDIRAFEPLGHRPPHTESGASQTHARRYTARTKKNPDATAGAEADKRCHRRLLREEKQELPL